MTPNGISPTLYLENTDVQWIRFLGTGDVLISSVAEPKEDPTETTLPVRKVGDTTYRLWFTALPDGEATIPFTTVTLQRKNYRPDAA